MVFFNKETGGIHFSLITTEVNLCSSVADYISDVSRELSQLTMTRRSRRQEAIEVERQVAPIEWFNSDDVHVLRDGKQVHGIAARMKRLHYRLQGGGDRFERFQYEVDGITHTIPTRLNKVPFVGSVAGTTDHQQFRLRIGRSVFVYDYNDDRDSRLPRSRVLGRRQEAFSTEDTTDGLCYLVSLCLSWAFYENRFPHAPSSSAPLERRKERFDNWLLDPATRLMDVVRNCFDANFEKCDFKPNIDLSRLYIS
jgi:mRNA-degrading endonuclease RelE of RelBE toxin-antitoxin system